MAIHNTQRKQLQRLMESSDWGAVEAFVNDFMLRTFAQSSIKRNTEFDTMWYAAEFEGGKRFVKQFLHEMEQEANNIEGEL